MSRISQVVLTTSQAELNGINMSLKCPVSNNASKMHAWFEFLLIEILKGHISGQVKLPLDENR